MAAAGAALGIPLWMGYPIATLMVGLLRWSGLTA